MKKLIGRIFRDENGVETIERVPEERFFVKWRMRPNHTPRIGASLPYLIDMACPKCGRSFKIGYKTIEDRDTKMANIKFCGMEAYNYCGRCGAHNIVEL